MIQRIQNYISSILTWERFFALMIVAGFESVSSMVVSKQWGLLYTPSCLAFCLLEISVIMSFRPTLLFLHLAVLAGLQGLMQIAGFIFQVFHMHGLPYIFYNSGIHALVIATFIRLLIAEKNDGNTANPAYHRLFRMGSMLGGQQATRVYQ